MCGVTAVLNLANCHGEIKSSSQRPQDKGTKDETEVHESQSSNHVAESLQDQLNNSLDIIKHRGPDSHGSWISDDSRIGMSIRALQGRVPSLMLVQLWAAAGWRSTTSPRVGTSHSKTPIEPSM